mmetsp:Transcript_14613/g.22165  ORF Transcript_14613/g.22165 Transcript_14613/m.22165 type:complete len:1026 (+) Transcript_14613:97-3174(+)
MGQSLFHRPSSPLIPPDEAERMLGRTEWERLAGIFDKLCDEDDIMTEDAFIEEVLNAPDSSYLASRIFQIFDHRGAGEITRQDFLCGMAVLKTSSEDQRIRFLFEVFDHSRIGSLKANDILSIMEEAPHWFLDADPKIIQRSLIEHLLSKTNLNSEKETKIPAGRYELNTFKAWAKVNLAPILANWVWIPTPNAVQTSPDSKATAKLLAFSKCKLPSQSPSLPASSSLSSDDVSLTDKKGLQLSETKNSVDSVLSKTHRDSKDFTSSPQSCKGLVGLYNLGNTCFLNASLQALSATPPLSEYFISDMYARELNFNNPLGMEGKVALYYAALIKRMWSFPCTEEKKSSGWGRATAIAPRTFKATIARFSPMFDGYEQHDAHELLAFVLDGLHEGLNRVIQKPYVEIPDSKGRSDAVVSAEQWNAFLKRNKSVIVDLFTGQLKSMLKFGCGSKSVKFDPYNLLSLPLPLRRLVTLKIEFIPYNEKAKTQGICSFPTRISRHVTVRVYPTNPVDDLIAEVSKKLDLDPSRLLLTLVQNHTIRHIVLESHYDIEVFMGYGRFCVFEIPSEVPRIKSQRQVKKSNGLHLQIKGKIDILDTDKNWLPATIESMDSSGKIEIHYDGWPSKWDEWICPFSERHRISEYLSKSKPRDLGNLKLPFKSCHVFPLLHRTHTRKNDLVFDSSQYVLFGEPLILCVVGDISREKLYESVWEHLEHVGLVSGSVSGVKNKDNLKFKRETFPFELSVVSRKGYSSSRCHWTERSSGFKLDYKGKAGKKKINLSNTQSIAIDWDRSTSFAVDGLKSLKFHEKLEAKRKREDKENAEKHLTLEECFERFILSESVEAYCSNCKRHRQAEKILEVWSSPRFLVIHLKRLLPTGKLFTFVDFPLRGLDMSKFMAKQTDIKKSDSGGDKRKNQVYDLYAVVNHLGNSLGGHYITYVGKKLKSGERKWYCFDDSNVVEMKEDQVKSRTAYMLFYEKRGAAEEKLDFFSEKELDRLQAPLGENMQTLLETIDEERLRNETASWCKIM